MTIEQILDDIRSGSVKRVIIDSDTYNEIDDQYAIAYALGASAMKVVALHAAPFENSFSSSYADGAEKSYQEMLHVLNVLDIDGSYPVFRGSETRISDMSDYAPVDSPAARNLIKEAHASDSVLYVLALGACTNIVSAWLMDPSIREKICVVWLGGNCHGHARAAEFNFYQDFAAGQILFNSGIPLVQLPAMGPDGCGTQMLRITYEDLQTIGGKPEKADFFRKELYQHTSPNEEKGKWSWVLWDVAAPALMAHPEYFELSLCASPVITDDNTYTSDSTRHQIIYMKSLKPAPILSDAFACIGKLCE